MKKYLYLLLSFHVFFSIYELQAQDTIQSQTITGVAVSQLNNTPIAGVSVSVPDFSSAMTDDSGRFVIKVPDNCATLLVKGPGFSPREINIKSRKELQIVLYDENFKTSYDYINMPFNEVMKSHLTYSVSSVKENNILSSSVSPENLLQSNTTGLYTIFRSGMPGNSANIFMHGFNSMNAGTMPLFVVDGVVYDVNSIGKSLVENYYANPLSSIDIKDIESITVLKDGTSLYGVKGGNGVVIVKSTHADNLDTRINFHVHTGINNTPQSLPLLNAVQQKTLLTELLQSEKYTVDQIQQLPYLNNQMPVLEKWGYEGNVDYYRYNNNTDWQSSVFNKSYNQDYFLNITGGDEISKLGLSIGYLNHKGIVTSTYFQRFNVRFNAEVNLSEKLKITGNTSFVYGNRELRDEGPFANTNPILAALVKSPFMASHIYSPDGKISPNQEGADLFDESNPFSLVDKDNTILNNLNYRFFGNYSAIWNIYKNLTANITLGLNYNKERERLFYPTVGVYFPTLPTGEVNDKLAHRVERLFSLYNEGRLDWKKKFSKDMNLNVMVGVRYQSNKAEDDAGTSYNSSSNDFKSIQYGDVLLRSITGSVGNWNWLSLFTSADFSYKNRYFISYNMAADASSRYGKDVSKFLLYPSLSAAWLISSEKFMHNFAYIDILKLRLSYGLSGNDNIGNYNNIQYYVPSNFIGTYGLIRGNLVNTNLRPETITRTNVGFDLSVLNERLSISFDYFKNTITDLITISSVTPVSGFGTYISNVGSMENTGFDIALYSRVINTKFTWDASINFSKYKNKVIDLNGDEFLTEVAGATIQTKVGQPLGVFYGHKTNGIYSSQEQANDAQLGVMIGTERVAFSAGDVIFVNKDNSNDIIDENDKQVIGDPNPDFTGSFNNSFNYKRFTLLVNFNFCYGNDIYNYTRARLESLSLFENQSQAVLNRWKAEGQITSIPKVTSGDPMGNSRFSDRWIEDGSYLRLKKAQLIYDIPIKQKILQNCQVYTAVENVFTITGYKGFDPEFAMGQSALYNGIDGCYTPQSLTFFLGIKLGL